jgi:hypothetical protein
MPPVALRRLAQVFLMPLRRLAQVFLMPLMPQQQKR